MPREFLQVGVVGLGTMGAGIVEVFARNGLSVVAVEKDETALEHGKATLEGSRSSARSSRGKLTEEQQTELLTHVSFGTDLAAMAEVDLVIEAVPEKLELKRAIFTELGTVCKPETILASNTSSLSITEIAVATGRPGKVVGMHFFNPAPVMKLVEVIRTVVTEQDVVDDVEAFAQRLGKTDVTIGDRAGFIANALLFGYLNHAVSLFESRYATPRGHRRRHEARLRPADGAARAARPDRPRHRLRDPRHDVRAVARPAARAASGLQADDDRRPARPQERQGLLHLRGAGIAEGRRRRADRRGDGSTSRAHARSREVGVVGSGTMATGIIEVFAKAGYDVTFVTRSADKSDKVIATITKSLDKAVGRGKLTEAERDAALGRLTPSTSLDDLAGVQLVVEAVVEDLKVKQTLFSNLDDICGAGHRAGHHHVVAAGDRVRGGHQPSRRRDRHALLQPGRR